MTNSELKDRLADTLALLAIEGVGSGRFNLLMKRYSSPAAVFEAPLSQLKDTPKIPIKVASAIKEQYDGPQARQTAARIIQLGWSVLFPDLDEYPARLAQIPDPPPLLFRLGHAARSDDKVIGLVGTRHASEAGRRFTRRLAAELTERGLTVVSGMAEGIDAAAHLGALDRGGRTIAVWGTPLDRVYPQCNAGLADQIKREGTVYSEYLPGVTPAASNFPERNRIIAGLSEAVVVIEAGRKSGALITAQFALDQNRELFAVPGTPWSKGAEGTNRLIRQGACLLSSADDVFAEIPRLSGEVSARQWRKDPDLTETERRMVDVLSSGPMQIDQLCRQAELTVPESLEFLLALELKGIVSEMAGKRFVLTEH